MTVDVERAESRLRNVRKVRPILAALRTISLSSWQMARNRQAAPIRYASALSDLLPAVLSRLAELGDGTVGRWRRARLGDQRSAGDPERRQRIVVMVVGSERGLCGRYNKVLQASLASALREDYDGLEIELMSMGTRMIRDLRAAGYALTWTRGLSVTEVPSSALARESVTEWLRRYERRDLDAVDVLYNAGLGAGTYSPKLARLIPAALPAAREGVTVADAGDPHGGQAIIDTDVVSLYARIVEQMTANSYYQMLLEAASTEHAARFQLMESATQNADDLSEELMLAVQSARRQAITRQMQELAVGAGLLDTRAS